MDMTQTRKEIGRRLKKCRMAAGFTQQQLSERIGLQTKSYSNIETGQTLFSIEVLLKLTTTLDISADYILFGHTNSPSPLSGLLSGMQADDLERIEQIVRIYDEAIKDHSKEES